MNLNCISHSCLGLAIMLCATFLLLPIAGNAQGYQNVTDLSGVLGWCDSQFGNGVSVYDFDNDGWDDISLASSANGAKFYRNLGDGTFEIVFFQVGFQGSIKSILWVDYDNDGDNDILICGYSNVRLYRNDGDFQFTDVTSLAGINNLSAQCTGACFGDVNNDGWLDLYICRYEYISDSFENLLYVSNQQGGFNDKTEIWGIGNDAQPSFQSTFFDVDRDGDQDLFVINDRDNYENTFYRNEGEYFINVSGFYDIDYDMWSMSNTVDDLNNDGYADVYVTNASEGNALFLNEGATGEEGFTDATNAYNLSVNQFCWASAFTDYDNNGLKDLWILSDPLVFGNGDHFHFTNTGDSCVTFQNSGTEESLGPSFSLGLCDLNNDGFQDVVTHSYFELGTELWKNQGVGGHFLKIDLVGTLSNKPAIGAYIDVFSSNGLSTAFVHCGENYLGQNSATEHFGLGNADVADSIVVHWPSGHIDRWFDVPANNTYEYIEGTSLLAQISASSNSLCAEGEIVLEGGVWDHYLWSTGDTTSYITVSDTGAYSLTVWTDLGFNYTSLPLTINFAPILEITPNIQGVSCFGLNDGAVDLQLDSALVSSIVWEDGQFETVADSLLAGHISFTLEDIYGCTYSDSISIESPDELLAYYSYAPPSCFGAQDGQVQVDSIQGAQGEVVIIYDDFDPDSMAEGEHSFLITDSLNCIWESSFELIAPDELTVTTNITEGSIEGTQTIETSVTGGTEPYSFFWSPGDFQTEYLIDVTPGQHNLLVTDSLGCTWEETFTLTSTAEWNASQTAVFPNPSHTEINLLGAEAYHQFLIYNSLGQMVLEVDNTQLHSQITLNISTLPSGSYCIRSADGRVFSRFMCR